MAGTRKLAKRSDSQKSTAPGKKLKFAVVVSRFNDTITNGLLSGAREYFLEQGVLLDEGDVYSAPGAFEMPLIAKKLAQTKRYAGVVCLGCVIKGDTAHFEFISLGATIGIQQASLETGVPIAFGILTTYDAGQAERRSGLNEENKGREAAAACLESALLLRTIR